MCKYAEKNINCNEQYTEGRQNCYYLPELQINIFFKTFALHTKVKPR